MKASATSSLFRSLLGASLILASASFTTLSAQIVFNTGLDSNGVKLTSAGQDDANWMVVATGTGNVTIPSATTSPVTPFAAKFAVQNSNYNNTPTNAGWIWETGASGSVPANRAVVFELAFDLTGYDVSAASLSGFWGVDNAGILSLNGLQISALASTQGGTASNFQVFTAFGPASLVSGMNYLQVTGINAGSSTNPAAVLVGGLELRGLELQAVPEPSTYGMIGGFLLLLAVLLRRFRNR